MFCLIYALVFHFRFVDLSPLLTLLCYKSPYLICVTCCLLALSDKLVGLDELCPEEFVAHASTVNCLKIGRKSSRVLVTGGEDHKVNLWAIGKPNAILVRSPLLVFLFFFLICI